MSSKSKGSLVLAVLLILGSAPSWAASVEGRPAFAESSTGSALSDGVVGALSRWLGSLWESGRSATAIWGEYGIAIDPNGVPVDPSYNTTAHQADPNTP